MPTRHTSNLHAHRWSEAGVRYFVTLCTYDRQMFLTETQIVESLLRSIRGSDAQGDTTTIAFTTMPDHVHWLFELGERLSLGRVIARFKAQTRNALHAEKIEWQRDFFEHRLRADESVEDYALYIFMNPYRAGITRDGNWPGWYTACPESLRFPSNLNTDGSPPAEWLNLVPPKPLVTGE